MALRPPDTKPAGCVLFRCLHFAGRDGRARPAWGLSKATAMAVDGLRSQPRRPAPEAARGASPGQGRTLGAAVWMGCRGSCCRCVAVTVSSALRFAVSHHPGLCPLSLLHDLFFLLHSQACLPPGPDAPRAHEGISRQTRAPGPPWKRWPSGPGRPRGGAGTAWARGSGRALWTSRPQR